MGMRWAGEGPGWLWLLPSAVRGVPNSIPAVPATAVAAEHVWYHHAATRCPLSCCEPPSCCLLLTSLCTRCLRPSPGTRPRPSSCPSAATTARHPAGPMSARTRATARTSRSVPPATSEPGEGGVAMGTRGGTSSGVAAGAEGWLVGMQAHDTLHCVRVTPSSLLRGMCMCLRKVGCAEGNPSCCRGPVVCFDCIF